jgi:hypothetical protein
MNDCIERKAVIQIIAAQCGECADACLEFDGIQPDCNQCLLHGAKKAIESIPAADVRPVVLCRDCYAYRRGNELAEAAYLDPKMYCGLLRCEMGEDSFCSYGKRKEET